MDMELNNLSLKELKDLQSRVGKAIATYEDRRKREALTQLEASARDLGFSLSELVDAQTQKKRPATAPRFANPNNADDTWSGRGRKPRWYIEAIESGKEPAELEIN
ncbi:H-NS histone family protein [Falsirhodobacter xinxiangensis]|uniref:H-NS histone family protein n=1 Tax=Falsirhodobacter xinxiangensis TaxID=2530049 RepID=UPI00145B0899|nr:H-NS histone family protein [Rhodobacter xinxiangensis]